jgi:hypothetical protein
MELIVWLPEVALAPDQAPVALQLEALVEDQVSRVEPPDTTEFGAALSETVGAGGDPGGGVLFPSLLSGVAPPPQATRPSAHKNTNDELQRVGISMYGFHPVWISIR